MVASRLVRRLHRWLGVAVGLQVLIWSLSGAYMVAVHIDVIHGDHFIRTPPEQPIELAGLIEPAALAALHPDLQTLTLKRWMDRPAYLVETPTRAVLLDARSGARLSPLDEEAARAVAQRRFAGDAPVVRAELLHRLPREVGGREPPLWRVEFAGWNKPTLYISPSTGELVTRRHELWRVFDLMWALHIMDYGGRENVNNPLLRATTLAALLLTTAGAWLLVYSFRRRRRAAA